MKSLSYFLVLLLSILAVSGCRTYKDPQIYSSFESRALAVEAGEIYLLRVQGKGQTRKDAVNNALMQAVRDMIFKNIPVTYGDHKTLLGLINNPALEEKHSDFFRDFFAKSGAYLRFVTPIKKDRQYFSSSSTQTVLINVKINRPALKAYLKENGIIR